MGYRDKYIDQDLYIYDEGVLVAERPDVNYTGAGISAADDPTNNRVNVTVSGGGASGDMLAATYDPQTIEGDAFDCDNHTDGSTNGVYTLAERTKLSGVEAAADVTDATNVASAGALMVANLENPPTEDLATKAPTSEWAFDHNARDATAAAQGHATAAQITKLDGIATGADVTADNAPQSHAASHAVSGADTVFPADPGEDKYLMWDDDPGALVWASPSGGGDVTAAANMTDNTIVKGDGGAKGVQDSGIAIDDSENITGVAGLSCTTLNVSGIATASTQLISHRASDTAATSPLIDLRRERDGDPTQDVSSGDYLGEIRFRGYHTDGYYEGAIIRAKTDGDCGSADMPTTLELATSANGSGTPTTRVSLTSAGGINLTAVTDVVVPVNVGVVLGDGAEKIESDNTDLTVNSGGDINLTATADINVPANIGMTFGDDGEKIEGDGTDLTIASSAKLNLSATSDVVVPVNVGVILGDGAEKLESDNTDLTISSGGAINLAATTNVVIPTGLTGVIRADSGVLSVDADVTDVVAAASDSTAGKVELATIAETNTGTDTGRAVTPDGLAGSVYGKRVLMVRVFEQATALATGDGKENIYIPSELNGYNLVDADACVDTVSSSGLPSIAIYNATDSQDMLSTNITIDATERTSFTAETPAAINASYDDVATGDCIRVDVDAAGTDTAGLVVILSFQLP